MTHPSERTEEMAARPARKVEFCVNCGHADYVHTTITRMCIGDDNGRICDCMKFLRGRS